MTDRDVSAQDTHDTVQIRANGGVEDEALSYIRSKVDAALARPGLEAVSGRVTVTRDTAHHVLLPWAAGAELAVDGRLVVVLVREADAHQLADRLGERLRAQAERAAHRAGTARRTAGPPPWRGGSPDRGGSRGSSPATREGPTGPPPGTIGPWKGPRTGKQ